MSAQFALRFLLVFLVCWIYLMSPGIAVAQDDDEDEDPFGQGLIGQYQQGERTIQRVDRRVAFSWLSEESPDPRFQPGRFQVRWRGRLQIREQGDYQLHVFAAGRVTIRVGDEVVLKQSNNHPDWMDAKVLRDLEFGEYPLQLDYERTGERGEIRLFWQGPRFGMEPISARSLLYSRDAAPKADSGEIVRLMDALRCAACHRDLATPSPEAGPSLRFLEGNLNPLWLVEHLTASGEAAERDGRRRMPFFGMNERDAVAVTAFLMTNSLEPEREALEGSERPKTGPNPDPTGTKDDGVLETDRDAGRRLLLTLGCLACHTLDEIGEDNLYGGSDLAAVADKRPESYFAQWLRNPAKLNPDHRMPVFKLTGAEVSQLSAFLKTRRSAKQREDGTRQKTLNDLQALISTNNRKELARGKLLVAKHGCAACHEIPNVPQPDSIPITQNAGGCAGPAGADRPHYRLGEQHQKALAEYLVERDVADEATHRLAPGILFARRNCTACHQRETLPGIAQRLSRTIEDFPELAAQTPAMTPPSLSSVGDKLTDESLRKAIAQSEPSLRPWLLVRMPKYRLSKSEQLDLVRHLVVRDRVPDGPHTPQPLAQDHSYGLAGARLVTPDGFGCTSCHQVGSVKPPKAPLNARGPDLSQLGRRIRYSWFDRWVRNPARIVPRMEMPSVQLPVSGVLDNNLDLQLATVWRVLNDPKFRPPKPNPVRVVRHIGSREGEVRPAVLTDVLRVGEKQYVKPYLIGLANRHNVLLDLSDGSLAGWWMGDTARQRTEGKTWYWEAGAVNLLPALDEAEFQLRREGKLHAPVRDRQFVTEMDRWRVEGDHLATDSRLRYLLDDQSYEVRVRQVFTPIWASDQSPENGWERRVRFEGLPVDASLIIRLVGSKAAADTRSGDRVLRWSAGPGGLKTIRVSSSIGKDGRVLVTSNASGAADVTIRYLSSASPDRFPPPVPLPNLTQPKTLRATPGFESIRLPLAEDVMPTAIGWRPDGRLVLASLKGRVWLGEDTNEDGLEDRLMQYSDELAAPFGVFATEDYVDVVNKYALLRLRDLDGDGRADSTETIASGWGHTADYHDWAVGLPQDQNGAYWIATACQQDKRSAAAAHLRGVVMKLTPPADSDSGRETRYKIETVTSGHRFPIGIALNKEGDVFVSDNQGNYNPFNELNKVVSGRSFGFINAIDRRPNFKIPPLTPPSINIPHPWTRSVNGLVFLDTPTQLESSRGAVFGPFEGHLVGAEYDTRRLIRMSLQEVDGWTQGAAYPFSHYHPQDGDTFLGPLALAVSPQGDLYVGCIRDSGWGGANNVGTLVRLRPSFKDLPPGIAEVRATPDGFLVDFTRPVDADRGAAVENYSIESYTRVSTPAYGGPDHNRRKEAIRIVQLSSDRMQARLRLRELRAGHVYEIRLRNLVAEASLFHPAEAFYSMTRVPDGGPSAR